ncbi:hypothetical protein ACF1BP_37510, partial [Streptomyces sp. NPDC014735]|uniref:hypothetical protein n=1 Tax=unclassified Streptomyces TaxID=2593676 RepID=UPI0036FD6A3F
ADPCTRTGRSSVKKRFLPDVNARGSALDHAERGIRLHHRTYDCDLLGPYRGQDSDVAARDQVRSQDPGDSPCAAP